MMPEMFANERETECNGEDSVGFHRPRIGVRPKAFELLASVSIQQRNQLWFRTWSYLSRLVSSSKIFYCTLFNQSKLVKIQKAVHCYRGDIFKWWIAACSWLDVC